jgi:hypothetical protein
MTLGAVFALLCIAVAAIIGLTGGKFVWAPDTWILCAIVFAILGGPVVYPRRRAQP